MCIYSIWQFKINSAYNYDAYDCNSSVAPNTVRGDSVTVTSFLTPGRSRLDQETGRSIFFGISTYESLFKINLSILI